MLTNITLVYFILFYNISSGNGWLHLLFLFYTLYFDFHAAILQPVILQNEINLYVLTMFINTNVLTRAMITSNGSKEKFLNTWRKVLFKDIKLFDRQITLERAKLLCKSLARKLDCRCHKLKTIASVIYSSSCKRNSQRANLATKTDIYTKVLQKTEIQCKVYYMSDRHAKFSPKADMLDGR